MSEVKEDRRQSPRKRMLKAGRIVFNGRHSAIDCVVRNMSARGALLQLPNVIGIPDDFELCIEGGYRSVHVVWKSDRSLGVVWD